mmetsp:Transcript_18143/g.57430  ORF Transcript_18143/g.57430 Transcript_18143/m.57430 type:complete len:261 (-) Transcript_18143:852-1634(-)
MRPRPGRLPNSNSRFSNRLPRAVRPRCRRNGEWRARLRSGRLRRRQGRRACESRWRPPRRSCARRRFSSRRCAVSMLMRRNAPWLRRSSAPPRKPPPVGMRPKSVRLRLRLWPRPMTCGRHRRMQSGCGCDWRSLRRSIIWRWRTCGRGLLLHSKSCGRKRPRPQQRMRSGASCRPHRTRRCGRRGRHPLLGCRLSRRSAMRCVLGWRQWRLQGERREAWRPQSAHPSCTRQPVGTRCQQRCGRRRHCGSSLLRPWRRRR